MKFKRLVAYLIDITIISFIASLIMNLPILNTDYEEYQKTITKYTEKIMNSGSEDLTKEDLIDITYNIQVSSQSVSIITIGLLIIYFGVIGFLCKGQTIGKKIMHLQIVSSNENPINPGLFILREIIVTNVIPRVALIIVTMYFTSSTWYNLTSIIGNIEYLIIFIIFGFMIFRDDERGLHDIICKTKVIQTNVKE